MFDFISIVGLVFALSMLAALIPCCPISLICPPFLVCSLPLLAMFVTTIGGLMAYWSSGVPLGGFGLPTTLASGGPTTYTR